MLHICRSNDGLSFNRSYGVVGKVLACCATEQGSNPGQVISQKCLIDTNPNGILENKLSLQFADHMLDHINEFINIRQINSPRILGSQLRRGRIDILFHLTLVASHSRSRSFRGEQ